MLVHFYPASRCCCSCFCRRSSLSFLVALPEDLRLDEAAERLTSPSREAMVEWPRPLASSMANDDRRALADLATSPRRRYTAHHCEVACRGATTWCHIRYCTTTTTTTTTALHRPRHISDCRRCRKGDVSLIAARLWLLKHCSSFSAIGHFLLLEPNDL